MIRAWLKPAILFVIIAAGCGGKDAHKTRIEVLDGDTFIASNGETVRLLGIDAPEKEQKYCQEADSLLSRLLVLGEIHLEYDGQRLDRYGRTLAYVFVNDIFVNESILDSGLAVVYLFKSMPKYRKEFIEAQKRARESLRNLWSIPVVDPCEFYLSTSASFRFHRPNCNSVSQSDISKLRRFETREEALDDGLSACRNCRP